MEEGRRPGCTRRDFNSFLLLHQDISLEKIKGRNKVGVGVYLVRVGVTDGVWGKVGVG